MELHQLKQEYIVELKRFILYLADQKQRKCMLSGVNVQKPVNFSVTQSLETQGIRKNRCKIL